VGDIVISYLSTLRCCNINMKSSELSDFLFNPFNGDIFLRSARTRRKIVQSLSLAFYLHNQLCLKSSVIISKNEKRQDLAVSKETCVMNKLNLKRPYDIRRLRRRQNAKYVICVLHVIYEMTYGIERVETIESIRINY